MPARSIEQIRNLCKRRGFIFPGSAAYGGLGSFWDYGPLGVEMLNHVKRAWWRNVVYERDDMEGLDSAIITSRKVWAHSGHEATFSDPLVDNKKTRRRFRLDKLLEAQAADDADKLMAEVERLSDFEIAPLLELLYLEYYGEFAGEADSAAVHLASVSRKLEGRKSEDVYSYGRGVLREVRNKMVHGLLDSRMRQSLYAILVHVLLRNPAHSAQMLKRAGVVDPDSNETGDWATPRNFNLMFVSHTGAVEADRGTEEELASRVYLRPETAQGIFMNFKHVQTALRRKVPFGIAQIGKSFRNEITPGNFIFRTREFEQMEMEFFIKPPQFVKPGEKTDEQWHTHWVEQRFNWWISLGIDPARLRKRPQDKAELAHYAKATTDIEYLFAEIGWGEVEGIANRTDYDLSAHSRDVPQADLKRLKLEKNADSTETLDYFDPDAKARYIPWVIEPAAGATRAMLAFMCEAYHEELVKQPEAAEVEPLKVEIDAVIKNAQKKIKEAEKASRESAVGSQESTAPDIGHQTPDTKQTAPKHDPTAIADFITKLEEMKQRLPASLLEIDNLLEDHPGAQNLEPVKKLKPKISKLAEDCVRVVLRLHPALAPVKAAIFPLKKNAPEIVDIAQRVTRMLSPFMRVQYDDSAGIGRLYRRQDEIGTPFCVTVDFDTLKDNTVTLRERDSMQQSRVKIEDLKHLLMQRLHMA